MADRVYAPLNTPQPSTVDPALNRTPSHPQIQQLPARYDPVLSLRELANPVINRTRRVFSIYAMGNPRLVEHAADDEGQRRACGALDVAKAQRKRGSSPPLPPLALIP